MKKGLLMIAIISVMFLQLTACTGTTPVSSPKVNQGKDIPGSTQPPVNTAISPSNTSIPPSLITPKKTISNKRIRPTFIQPVIENNTVSINLVEITKNVMTHFNVVTSKGSEVFMAYLFNDQNYVRPSICVPCGGQSYSLVGATLVCDICGTVFDAATGDGIKGGCVRFPKEPVSYQSMNNLLVINTADLITAYEDTLKPD